MIVYYRCDEGKGTLLEDLSDYGNNGIISDDDRWIGLDNDPMETEDKWGRKCPPQFALSSQIILNKKLNTRSISELTI